MRMTVWVVLFITMCVLGSGLAAGCRKQIETDALIPDPQGSFLTITEADLPWETKSPSHDEPVQTKPVSGAAVNLPQKPALLNTQETYSQEDMVEFILVGGDEIIYSVGPCNIWFERKENRKWVKVGTCPNSSFTDEPFSLGPGDKMSLVMPLSYQSEDLYSYVLTAGKYRLAFGYWTDSQDEIVYSPEFEIRE